MGWMLVSLLIFIASVATGWYLLSSAPKTEPNPKRVQNQTKERLKIVYPEQARDTADNADVDIIAVHGLGSDADWSWIHKDGDKHVNWLRDVNMLPAKVPKARIMVYRYESAWHMHAPHTRLQLCGEELVYSLHSFRANCPSRPLVFIGHSLGGNVIVQAALYANEDARYRSLLKTIVGLVFLGTPFRGSKWQPLADIFTQLMRPMGSHGGILRELGDNEPALLDRLHSFCMLRNKLLMSVACFAELYETDYGRRLGVPGMARGMVVDEASAWIPGVDRFALEKDHLKINKYYGPKDPAFIRVSDVITEMCRQGSNVVRRRFEGKELITDNRAALEYNPNAEACLNDLFVTDPLADKQILKFKKGDRAAGTCEWILGTHELTAWLGPSLDRDCDSPGAQVLWLHGNPGAGKSTLAIFLTDALSKGFSAADGKTLAYFFCDSAYSTRRTAPCIIRGLLLQLIQQHPQLLSYVLPTYNQRKANLFEPESFPTLWNIFISAAADFDTGRKYCIIDALDECDAESQNLLLRSLESTFNSSNAPSNLRLLVTSRPYQEIRKHLGDFTNKDLTSFPQVEQDVDRCIKERVAKLKYTESLKERITEILKAKAEGKFLWVGLACNELADTPSKDAIARLNAMPSGLHSLYQDLLSRAFREETEKGTIQLVLNVVAVSMRPLTLMELSEACRLHQDEGDMATRIDFIRDSIAACRLMVIIQKDDTVTLLHQSAKDFLISENSGLNELQAHADLAYCCLDHLISEFDDIRQVHNSFSDYAIKHWPGHASMAHSKFVVGCELEDFFKVTSPCRDSWLLEYSRQDKYSSTEKFSVWHVAARWGLTAVADHVRRFQHDEGKEIINLTDLRGYTPLECAATWGHLDVMRVLLEMEALIRESVTPIAARNEENGKEMMGLLLKERGHELIITEEVLQAAARNSNGKEIMSLLLKERGHEVVVTEEVLQAAAGNENGEEIVSLLLKERGNEVTVTEEVLLAVAGNHWDGEKIMSLLLKERGNEVTVTEEVLLAVAGNHWDGEKIMSLLLKERGHEVTVTEEVLKVAASNWDGGNTMSLLLKERGHEVTVTEEVLQAAAENENGEEMMSLLLKERGHEFTITEEVLKEAAGNGHGKEIMSLLLKERGHEVTVTEEVLKAAARNWDGGNIMSFLLKERGHEVTVTEEVLKVAASNWDKGDIMSLLLKERGHEVTITEEVLKAAAKNWDIMSLLLKERGHEVTITEEVLKVAAACEDGEKIVSNLLKEQGHEVIVTEEVLQAAVGNHRRGKEIMLVLLQERGHEVTITEEVLKAAAKNGEEIVSLLLKERGQEVIVTEDVLKAAAGNHWDGEKIMSLLLEERGHEVIVTEDVLKAATGNYRDGEKIMSLLLKERGHEVTVTEEVLKAAVRNWDIMSLLLQERGHEVTITEEVLKAAAKSGEEIVSLLLKERGQEVIVTEDVLKAAAGNRWDGEKIMSLLLKERGNEVIVSEGLLMAATKGVMSVLLKERGHEVTVTEEVLQAMIRKSEGEEIISLLLKERGHEVMDIDAKHKDGQILLSWAAENGHDEVVKLLLASEKVDADAKDSEYGRTPLSWAAENGHDEVVKLLLASEKVDADAKDSEYGRTPLSWAAENGHDEVVKLLLASEKVDADAKDIVGRTPLSIAIMNGHPTVATILLRQSMVDPDHADYYGQTPLSIAVRHCLIVVIKQLLATGRVATESQDCFGRTLLYWARNCGNPHVEQALFDQKESRGMPVYESDSTKTNMTPYKRASRWCDVCTLFNSEDENFFECAICYGGDFDVCSECCDIGGHCLNKDHELIRRGVEG